MNPSAPTTRSQTSCSGSPQTSSHAASSTAARAPRPGTEVPPEARLVLATHNLGKLAELRAILAPLVPGSEAETIVSAASLRAPEPAENGLTFADNALVKARALAAATGLPALADDSGLCVDVLGGAPGIFSARWSGRHGDDTANLRLLLNQLSDVKDPHRTARFVCAAVLVVPAGRRQGTEDRGPGRERVVTVEGVMEGRLVHEPRGQDGFGYDPAFVPLSEDAPDGLGRTTAQMSRAEKNALSHRGKAFSALAPTLAELLS